MSGPWIALMCALWLVVVALAVLVLGLIRRVEQLEGRSSDHGPAARAKTDSGPAVGLRPPVVRGYESLSTVADAVRSRVVLFLSTTCGACERLTSELQELSIGSASSALLDAADIVLVGDRLLEQEFRSAPWPVFTQDKSELTRGWVVPGTPFAVMMGADGLVQRSTFVTHLSELEELVRAGRPSTAFEEELAGTR